MKITITLIIIVLALVLWFKAISDISRTRFKSDKNNRFWFLIVFFLPIVGAIVYFSMKKKYIAVKSGFHVR